MMELPIELNNATSESDGDRDLYIMAEDHIRNLSEGHQDITGAAISLKEPSQNNETPFVFEATVVLYMRPANISATEKDVGLKLALKGALDAVERQVRKKRERLRNY